MRRPRLGEMQSPRLDPGAGLLVPGFLFLNGFLAENLPAPAENAAALQWRPGRASPGRRATIPEMDWISQK